MASTGQPSIASLQKCLFLRGLWLFQHLGVTTIVVARKISRRGLATKVAINALVIHVKPPSHILWMPVCKVSNISLSSSNSIFPEAVFLQTPEAPLRVHGAIAKFNSPLTL
jgi:hypothetical protein